MDIKKTYSALPGLTRPEAGYKELADVHCIAWAKPDALMLGEMRCTWKEGVIPNLLADSSAKWS